MNEGLDQDPRAGDVFGPVPLRGHHLFCLHFFRGEGCSPAFVAALARTMSRADADGCVLVEGADAVCAACPELVDGVCISESAGDAEVLRLDSLAARVLRARAGDTFTWAELAERLPATAPVWFAGACPDCAWLEVCRAAGLEEFVAE